MDGRKRTVQIKFRVTEAERDLILEKMKLVPTRNMAAYLSVNHVVILFFQFLNLSKWLIFCQFFQKFFCPVCFLWHSSFRYDCFQPVCQMFCISLPDSLCQFRYIFRHVPGTVMVKNRIIIIRKTVKYNRKLFCR